MRAVPRCRRTYRPLNADLMLCRAPSIKNTRKNLGVRWSNKSQPIDEAAITIETGGRIFVDPAGNLVVNLVNKYDESAYRCAFILSF